MRPDRWQRIKEIVAATLERGVEERAQFLNETCQADASLRREVDSLLAAYEKADGFLEHPVFSLLGRELGNISEGSIIDRYRLVRLLGDGGMGTVYLAARGDDEFQQLVAIKLLRWKVDKELVQRFRAERQILAQLNHPNIARLFDGGTIEGRPFFVMEYIDGEALDRFCESRRLSVRERLEIFQRICSAVHFAHQNLVIHRDLKPSNILVTAQSEPKLLDFGIAKILEADKSGSARAPTTNLRPMTPDYASPEQLRGEPIATTSDVYSLGIILYELLTGTRPGSPQRRLLEQPPRPSVIVSRELEPRRVGGNAGWGEDPAVLTRRLAGDLDNIVLMALRQEPERRYSSAAELSEDIRRHLAGLPVLATKDTLGYRTSKFIRRHRFGVATAFLIILLASLSLAGLFVQHQRTLRERDRAEQVAEFLVNIFKSADPSESRGEEITARELLEQGAQSIRRQLVSQPEVQAQMLNTLGEVYAGLGLYGQAEELLIDALEIRQEILGPWHVEVADSLDNLASVHALKGRYESAETLYRRSIAIFRRSLGENNPRVAESLDNFGALLAYKGDYDAAELLLRESLEKHRRGQDAKGEQVATNLSNLASVLKIKGEHQEARSLYEEALGIRRNLYGEEHSSVATTLNNIGWLLEAAGDSARAKSFYLKALRLRRKILGPDHPQVATTLHNLASTFEDTGDYASEEEARRDALGIWRKNFGPEHPLIANGLTGLANMMRRKGELGSAEQTHRESLSMRRKLLPAKHRDIMVSLNNLAIVMQDMGDYPSAERLFLESLKLRQELWGREHRDVALALNNLATLLEDSGDLREAERLHREALAIRHRLLEPGHPEVLGSMGNLAVVLNARRKGEEAVSLVREALSIAHRSRLADPMTIAQLQSILGECLVRSENYEEAESLLIASFPVIRSGFHYKTRPTRKAIKRLIELYRAWNKPHMAREYEVLLKG